MLESGFPLSDARAASQMAALDVYRSSGSIDYPVAQTRVRALGGARHVPGKPWLMGWAARPFYLPATDALARVTAVYRLHPVNVALIRAHRTARQRVGGR